MTDINIKSPTGAEAGADETARPASAVGQATGLVGVAGVALTLIVIIGSDIPIGTQTILLLFSAAVPIVLWSLLIERVYRNPTTGLDFSAPRPLSETLATTKVKLVGLWSTWVALGLFYFSFGVYRDPGYEFFFALLTGLIPVIMALSVVYVVLVDRYMREPRDTLWHAGQWILGGKESDPAMLREHARGWVIKGFFLALMFTSLPWFVSSVTGAPLDEIFADPARTAVWVIFLIYMFDVGFGVTGYIFTSRLLDAHIRSSNPYLWSWLFVLICYPPLVVFGTGGPLDYKDKLEWSDWMAGNDTLLILWGVVLVLLTLIYVWATIIFGPRFSNLTHRGIITNGPYRFFKHPAYLSKNLQWWLVSLPFLSMIGPADAVRNCLLLLSVNFIYYMRARTEEWHLMEDPDYQAYSAWIAENGLLPRLRRALFGRWS